MTFTNSPVDVHVFRDLQALSRAAAARFADASVKSITSKGTFSVAISGGSTPRSLYLLLSSDYYIRTIAWPHVHIFWADERCVPEDDEQSNFKLAYDTFLSKVPVPEGNVHRVKGAKEYEATMEEFFEKSVLPVFDLIMLGLGEDGHTASLFPGSPALEEKERFVVAVSRQPPEPDRVTLILPVLNNALRIIFLVSGSAKAHILQKVLEDPQARRAYPAGLVCPTRGKVTWLIDKAAAALLAQKYP